MKPGKAEHQKSNKRSDIVKAAIDVFSRKGYHNTRMEEIALVAGAGKGTIYEYFDGKLELFQEILSTGWQAFEENTALEKIESLPIEELLQGLIYSHLRFFEEHRQLTQVTFGDVGTIDRELIAWARQMRADKERRLQALIETAMVRQEIRDDLDARVISRLLCAIIPYFAVTGALDGKDHDSQALADQITSALLNGIKRQNKEQ